MPVLSEQRVAALLQPYLPHPSETVIRHTLQYVDLLLQWNARTNLTAVRDPEQIVQRQVGESLFCAQLIPGQGSLLDFGSGAGFPGIPLTWVRPELTITLAESQGKKASFLREAVRLLGLRCTVWARRVEDLPAETAFDVVAMRAVDKTPAMLSVASEMIAPGGKLIRFLAELEASGASPGWSLESALPIPLSRGRVASYRRS